MLHIATQLCESPSASAATEATTTRCLAGFSCGRLSAYKLGKRLQRPWMFSFSTFFYVILLKICINICMGVHIHVLSFELNELTGMRCAGALYFCSYVQYIHMCLYVCFYWQFLYDQFCFCFFMFYYQMLFDLVNYEYTIVKPAYLLYLYAFICVFHCSFFLSAVHLLLIFFNDFVFVNGFFILRNSFDVCLCKIAFRQHLLWLNLRTV